MEEKDDIAPPWRSRALCFLLIQTGDTPANLWFSDDPEDQQMAAGACFQCPVRLECLKQAVQNKEPYGIWGGLKPEDRFLNGRHRAYSFLKGMTDER